MKVCSFFENTAAQDSLNKEFINDKLLLTTLTTLSLSSHTLFNPSPPSGGLLTPHLLVVAWRVREAFSSWLLAWSLSDSACRLAASSDSRPDDRVSSFLLSSPSSASNYSGQGVKLG